MLAWVVAVLEMKLVLIVVGDPAGVIFLAILARVVDEIDARLALGRRSDLRRGVQDGEYFCLSFSGVMAAFSRVFRPDSSFSKF